MTAQPGVLNDFVVASALTIQIGIAIPLAFYYSDQGDGRPRLRRWFVWPATIGTALLSAYLIAALDYHISGKQNVWDVFSITFVFLIVLSFMVLSADRKRLMAAPTKANSDTPPLETQISSSSRDREQENIKLPALSVVEICMSSAQYAEAIIGIEENATQIDRMVKRVSAVFKDPSEVEAIAAKRFGPGSTQAKSYLWEHKERRRAFLQNLHAGTLTCREIYNIEELTQYLEKRRHGANVTLDRSVLRRTVGDWLDAISSNPNYYIGLTQDPIPLKYQVFDHRGVVIHEAIGSLDGQRLNALVIRDLAAVKLFQGDFDHVWDRIPSEMRERRTVLRVIHTRLVPLLGDEE